MGASVLATGLLGAAATPLAAQSPQSQAVPLARRQGRRIVDGHVHLWKLPRNAPPISDNATFPTGCCGSVPWMEVDRLTPDYDARVGSPTADKVVLIEASVGGTAAKS